MFLRGTEPFHGTHKTISKFAEKSTTAGPGLVTLYEVWSECEVINNEIWIINDGVIMKPVIGTTWRFLQRIASSGRAVKNQFLVTPLPAHPPRARKWRRPTESARGPRGPFKIVAPLVLSTQTHFHKDNLGSEIN